MNDQKIYEYLARKPDSRAQDLADAMDVELKVASDALRALVDCGDVVRHTGIARNGVSAQLYHLSVEFRTSRDGKALIASVQPVEVVAATQAPDVPQAAAVPLQTPVLSQLTELAPARTKVQMAIDFLTSTPNATDAQMRIAMGLPKTSSPSTYLASALRAGRVVKTATGWNIASGKPDAEVKQPPAIEPVVQFPTSLRSPEVNNVAVIGNTIVASKDHKQIAPAVLATAVEAETPEPVTPVFRCALWSDGVLELQRNGRSLVELTRGEGEHIADFMRRMWGEADKAAA